jgi:hypothetical protein
MFWINNFILRLTITHPADRTRVPGSYFYSRMPVDIEIAQNLIYLQKYYLFLYSFFISYLYLNILV